MTVDHIQYLGDQPYGEEASCTQYSPVCRVVGSGCPLTCRDSWLATLGDSVAQELVGAVVFPVEHRVRPPFFPAYVGHSAE